MPESAVPAAAMIAVDVAADATDVAVADAVATTVDAADGKDCSERQKPSIEGFFLFV